MQLQTQQKADAEQAKEEKAAEQLDPRKELENLEASVKDLQRLATSNLLTTKFEMARIPGKIPGILLTAILLGLGASFWYDALKNLLRLRPALASQEQTERESRRASQAV